jgi:ankyrin repeat protein
VRHEKSFGETFAAATEEFKNEECVSLLLELETKRNPSLQRALGTNPLTAFSNIHMVDAYLGPLHYAVFYNDIDILQLALAAGSNPSRRFGLLGITPLHNVCTYRNPEIVETLLAFGADPTLLDRRGRTPLHELCAHRDFLKKTPLSFLKSLYHEAIDLDLPDSSGYSILQYLAIAGHGEGLKTALDYSKNVDFCECLSIFLQHGGKFDGRQSLEDMVRGLALPQHRIEQLLGVFLEASYNKSNT